jgi:uncharacterized metal-binding protein YceD (DUF177 family)
MNTGSEDRLSYRELARQQARIQRSIDLQNFSRIQALMDAESGRHPRVAVDVTFHLDSAGFPWVTGMARLELDLLCLRCAEVVDYPLEAEWKLCIVNEDELDAATMSTLAESRDLLAVGSATLALADVVEDELLLAMPERLCSSDPCERMPALDYPVADSELPAVEVLDPDRPADDLEQESPFAMLAELLDQSAAGVDGENTDSEK